MEQGMGLLTGRPGRVWHKGARCLAGGEGSHHCGVPRGVATQMEEQREQADRRAVECNRRQDGEDARAPVGELAGEWRDDEGEVDEGPVLQ